MFNGHYVWKGILYSWCCWDKEVIEMKKTRRVRLEAPPNAPAWAGTELNSQHNSQRAKSRCLSKLCKCAKPLNKHSHSQGRENWTRIEHIVFSENNQHRKEMTNSQQHWQTNQVFSENLSIPNQVLILITSVKNADRVLQILSEFKRMFLHLYCYWMECFFEIILSLNEMLVQLYCYWMEYFWQLQLSHCDEAK